MARLANQGSFAVGDGRKRGRAGQIPRDVIEAARQWTMPAIKTLADVMEDKEQNGAARVVAAKTLLDRGWGQAPQLVRIDSDRPVIDLAALARRLMECGWDRDSLPESLRATTPEPAPKQIESKVV